MAEPGRTRSHLFWPALLIILGLVLLLANVGLLPPIAWRSLRFLWPVVLIVLGIELLVTGRISWAGVLGAVVALFILAIAAGALGLRGGFFDPVRLGGVTDFDSNPNRADVQISAGAAHIEMR
jgi:hypothetical protein